MQKRLLSTFDYELFLGPKSGTVDRCLLQPTNQLLDLFDRYKLPHAIFFVDSTYLLRLEEVAADHQAAANDLQRIGAQLQDMIERGHYVYPHIHPHWIDAQYNSDTNQWSLTDLTRYRFHNASKQEQEALFDGSVRILRKLLGPQGKSWQPEGYRAGGWCIQPFSDFQPLFRKHNVRYEFSVLPGISSFTNAQYHDFSQVPAREIYQFSDSVTEEDQSGPYTQFTISSIEVPPSRKTLERLQLKVHWKLNIRSSGDGQGVIPTPVAPPNGTQPTPAGTRERLSVELLNSVKLPLYKRYINQHDYAHFLSHPKMLSSHHLKNFDRFLAYVTARYEVESDFKKMIAA